MGDLEAQSTNSQAAQPWSYQLFIALLLVLFTMSALTVYVAIKNSQNEQKIEDLQNMYMDDEFKTEQDGKDDIIMTKHTIRAARNVDGSGEVCKSQFYPNLNITPSAHLVGSDSMDTDANSNSGFLVAWRCNLTNVAHVIGGMKTNRAGELTVPVSGIYYIYVQLRMEVRVAGSIGKTKKLWHQIKIRRTIWNTAMERYESLNYDDDYSYETTDYYGGLHYLNKGDAIAIRISNPCRRGVCSLEVLRNRSEKSNFFGAFLVTPANKSLLQGQ